MLSGTKASRENGVEVADRIEVGRLKGDERSYSDALNERKQCSEISDRRQGDRDNGS
jgi:hypothetical protein